MLPSVLQPNETDHVPVLAEEVRELLAIEPGQTVVDATFGAGGHAAVLAADLQGRRPLHRDRPRPDRAAVLRGLQAPRRRAVALPARRGLGRPRPAGRERRARRRDPARPRRLEHAARPAGARVLVRGRRAARHAHGPDRGADRRRARQRGVGARADHDLPQVRRGALREADRARDRAAPPQAADRAHRRPRGHHPRRDPRARAVRRRPSGEARLPGAPDRRQRRARRARGGAARLRSRCCVPAAASP